jgi:hypothetical protein
MTMKAWIPGLIVVGVFVIYEQARSQPPAASKRESMERSAAATYESLATAIIAIEATEDELVKSILLGYHAAAQGHLRMAIRDEKGRRGHLEAAAAEIANIANEGDKRIQAVRQRLAKAGHTHNTDVETKEDYLFVNSKEKTKLLALAKRTGNLGEDAKAEDIRDVEEDLSKLIDSALAEE